MANTVSCERWLLRRRHTGGLVTNQVGTRPPPQQHAPSALSSLMESETKENHKAALWPPARCALLERRPRCHFNGCSPYTGAKRWRVSFLSEMTRAARGARGKRQHVARTTRLLVAGENERCRVPSVLSREITSTSRTEKQFGGSSNMTSHQNILHPLNPL